MDLMHAQRQVTGMIHAGTPFDAIEDQIQRIPDLVDDQRSALWLYAWSRQRRDWQRHSSARLLLWAASSNGQVDKA